jgi:hypothetical protein
VTSTTVTLIAIVQLFLPRLARKRLVRENSVSNARTPKWFHLALLCFVIEAITYNKNKCNQFFKTLTKID